MCNIILWGMYEIWFLVSLKILFEAHIRKINRIVKNFTQKPNFCSHCLLIGNFFFSIFTVYSSANSSSSKNVKEKKRHFSGEGTKKARQETSRWREKRAKNWKKGALKRKARVKETKKSAGVRKKFLSYFN